MKKLTSLYQGGGMIEMSIEDIKEWDELTPEKRRALAQKLVEKYPSLFCWILEHMNKCVCKEGHK